VAACMPRACPAERGFAQRIGLGGKMHEMQRFREGADGCCRPGRGSWRRLGWCVAAVAAGAGAGLTCTTRPILPMAMRPVVTDVQAWPRLVVGEIPSEVVRLGVGPWEVEGEGALRAAAVQVRNAAAALLRGRAAVYEDDDVVACSTRCPADSCGYRSLEETPAMRHTWEAAESPRGASPASDSVPQSPKRTYVFVVGPPHHGTTAVYGLLSTSPHASTLAGHGNWAGEGTWLLRRDAADALGAYVRNRWDPGEPLDMCAVRTIYESYWNMSRSVLVEKSPPSMMRLREIKAAFEDGGESAVKFVFVVRSPCEMRHSTTTLRHHPEAHGGETGPDDVGSVDVGYAARYYVTQMHNLARHGLDGILVRHEDLVRDPYGVVARLLAFVPALGSLDPTRVDDAFASSMSRSEDQYRLKGVASFAHDHVCRPIDATCLPAMYAPVLDFFY
jgi:hypothetical protein